MDKTAQKTIPVTKQKFPAFDKMVDNFFRRMLDILASLIGLLLLSPLFLVVAILIKRDTPGPVFFRGPRVGKGGKEFGILKFRTMYERPESYEGALVTASGDTRITKLGQKLRDSKINELPQLWNVFVGDMSLVGPRPEDPKLIKDWPEQYRNDLLSIRPGITSPASILYRNEETMLTSNNLMEDYFTKILPDKLRLDWIYLRHRTFFTDIDVILWTLISILPNHRDEPIQESDLLWGPLTQFTTRYLFWLVIDFLVILLSLLLTVALWSGPMKIDLNVPYVMMISFFIALCFGLYNTLFGLKKVSWGRASAGDAFLLFLTCGLAIGSALGMEAILSWYEFPSALLVNAGLFAFLGVVAVRYRTRLVTGAASRWLRMRGKVHAIGERVLVVGAGNNGELATMLLSRRPYNRAFTTTGIVDDDPRKQKMAINGIPVYGSTSQIPELVEKLDIHLILFTIWNISAEKQQKIIEICRSTPARLAFMPDVLSHLHLDGEQPDFNGKDGFSPESLLAWTDEMEQIIRTEDWKTAQQKLVEFRAMIQGNHSQED